MRYYSRSTGTLPHTCMHGKHKSDNMPAYLANLTHFRLFSSGLLSVYARPVFDEKKVRTSPVFQVQSFLRPAAQQVPHFASFLTVTFKIQWSICLAVRLPSFPNFCLIINVSICLHVYLPASLSSARLFPLRIFRFLIFATYYVTLCILKKIQNFHK